jgi:hypothetical protein
MRLTFDSTDCIHSTGNRDLSSRSRIKECSLGLLAVWGVAVVAGILYLEAYAADPGDHGAPEIQWPPGSRIPIDHHRPTLLVFLHPHCPCSQASLGELANIKDRCRDQVSVHAIVLNTPVLDRWGGSEIESGLAGLADIHVHRDRGGAEARRFGVATSGHVLLYDPEGRLIFSGGITAARGHAGDNYGRAAVIDRILREEARRVNGPVFGCPLMSF